MIRAVVIGGAQGCKPESLFTCLVTYGSGYAECFDGDGPGEGWSGYPANVPR